MLRISMAASLLAMTLSVDAFAAVKRETYETEERNASRGLGLRPTDLENHRHFRMTANHLHPVMNAVERARVIEYLIARPQNVNPQFERIANHLHQAMSRSDSSVGESRISRWRQLFCFWSFFYTSE